MNRTTTLVFMKRWAPWGLAALAAATLVFWALQPRPLEVTVAQVRTGRFEQAIDEDGQLRLKKRYVVSAPVAAELVRPTLQVGDSVRAGDVVATLRPLAPTLVDERNRRVLLQRVRRDDAARMAAAAQLQRLQTALAQAELEMQRALQLADDHFIAPAARDQAVLAHRAAAQALAAGQAQLQVAEFTLAESQAALSTSPTHGLLALPTWALPSPVDGQVVKLNLSSGGPVAAGQALLEIGDIQALEAVVDVLSSDAWQISPGASVRLSPGVGAAHLTGQVMRVEPVAFTKMSALGIEEQRVNVVVEWDRSTDRTPRWGEGFRVDAHITVFVQDNALLVPTAALVRDGLRWQVLVHQNGRAHAKSVTLQARNADVAWVKAQEDGGVQTGDAVLLYPGTITDGQRVKVKTQVNTPAIPQ